MQKRATTVMVFGVFDGLHEGHAFLFTEAKKHGKKLIAVVARDETAFRLKNRLPKMPLEERVKAVQEIKIVSQAVSGDNTEGIWEVVWKYQPDVIAFGYDQEKLKAALEKDKKTFNWEIKFITVGSHEPEKFHSSLR